MARRSKGNDKTLMYSIIGVFAIIIILGIALIISQNANQEPEIPDEDLLEYTGFEHLTNFDTLDDQTEDVYAVYYYQYNCGACQSIKQAVLEMTTLNNSGLKIYLMDATSTTGSKDRIVLQGVTIRYTPTMLVYRDGELVEMLVGSDNILPFIDDVDSGNYSN